MESPMDHQIYGAPGAYGALYDAGAAFGDKRHHGEGKGAFVRGQRRRLNAQPIFLALLVPWALFSVVYAALCFDMRYQEPGLAWSIVGAGFMLVCFTGIMACSASGRWFANAEREPTWLIFLFLSMLIAFLFAFSTGAANFKSNMQPYYNMHSLNNYTDVSPVKMRGQQLMDAGIIEFTNGTKLDTAKSMGFKHGKVFCVAPIVQGDQALVTYDFWAVGVDCCSGNQANFHCPHFNNPHANGGLRLMTDDDRPYYRLAVQQAEATYNIKAVHPLFFEWSIDPISTVDSWRYQGRSEYIVWVMSYLVFQAFLVAVATLAFAKMGFN